MLEDNPPIIDDKYKLLDWENAIREVNEYIEAINIS